jgi:hypothetical protein
MDMEKSLLIGLAILLLTTSALSGCFWRAEDERDHVHERDRGVHGEHHEDNGDYR